MTRLGAGGLLLLLILEPSMPALRIRIGGQDQDQQLAAKYLSQFGYLDNVENIESASMTSAIRKFQAFAELRQSGDLDPETTKMMRTPRCGVKDVLQEDEDHPRSRLSITLKRGKRYVLQGSRWKTQDLSYKITKYPEGLTKEEVDQTIAQAFRVWEKATPLKFTQKNPNQEAQIEIRFESSYHGDDDVFDGEGGTLAHAFFPMFGGDIHIDEDEDWTVNSSQGTSLLMTAAHEIGHSLGLSHSNVRNSLMAPFYRGYIPNLMLSPDDVRGIQALYGKNTNTSVDDNSLDTRATATASRPQPRRQPAQGDNRDRDVSDTALCTSGRIDTMVVIDLVTYAFLGDQYWRLTSAAVEPGFPRSISSDWDGLPGDLDASFTYTNGKTYFFKGSKYWRFTAAGQVDPGYPRKISVGFPGIPNNVDAAFTRAADDKIYFFKDSRYWKFNPEGPIQLDASYPKPISNWDGVPNNLDSALQYTNGKSYFFKAGRYYRFNDSTGQVDDSARPSFPRETGFWWFGCQSRSSPFVAMITITG